MNTKFEIGDIVQVTKWSGYSIPTGQLARVVAATYSSRGVDKLEWVIDVEWINTPELKGYTSHHVVVNRFELVARGQVEDTNEIIKLLSI